MIEPYDVDAAFKRFWERRQYYLHVRGRRRQRIIAVSDAAARAGRVFCAGDKLWETDAAGNWKRLAYDHSGQYNKRF